jgi:serine/threonine protein kinase
MGCVLEACSDREPTNLAYAHDPPASAGGASQTQTQIQQQPESQQQPRTGSGAEPRNRPLRALHSEPIIPDTREDVGFPPEFAKFYDIGSLVGVGTTSKVYRVYHRIHRLHGSSKSALACKVIDKRNIVVGLEREEVEPLLAQLRKEVEILRRIQHSNIVSFVDFMETRNKLFIVTERLDGGELFEQLLRHGPLQEDLACQVLYGVFSAVAYLHERGVVHRYVKHYLYTTHIYKPLPYLIPPLPLPYPSPHPLPYHPSTHPSIETSRRRT